MFIGEYQERTDLIMEMGDALYRTYPVPFACVDPFGRRLSLDATANATKMEVYAKETHRVKGKA